MKNYDEILKRADANLEALEFKTKDILYKAEQGIKITKRTLGQLRELVVIHEFKKHTDEISFFKRVQFKLQSIQKEMPKKRKQYSYDALRFNFEKIHREVQYVR